MIGVGDARCNRIQKPRNKGMKRMLGYSRHRVYQARYREANATKTRMRTRALVKWKDSGTT